MQAVGRLAWEQRAGASLHGLHAEEANTFAQPRRRASPLRARSAPDLGSIGG